ncbi:hypothetical protein BYT27DRAFT_7342039, partial [Phlegmacium glaucopus]
MQLPQGCEHVTEADEEIFILYSELQANISIRGLGYVDSHRDVLDIKFELNKVVKSKSRKDLIVDKVVEIELFQDKTALRTRRGDTGSVLWKASVDVGQLILQQHYSDSTEGLLNNRLLETQHVLELGSGTGLLSIALAPLVRRYTATDIGPLISLIRKNVTLNFPGWPNISSKSPGANIAVEELDWQSLESAPISQRAKAFNFEPVDLLLVVDCIYHPSLLSSLVTTIDYLSIPGRTTALVISELRAEDVMREFMETWLSNPAWEVWRVPNEVLGKHYAIWMGWKPLAETT